VLERVVDPIVADMQYEWRKAVARGDRRAALFVRLRGYADFGRAVLLQALTGEWRPPPVTVEGPPRIAVGMGVAFVGLCAVLMTWSFGEFWSYIQALPATRVRPGTLTLSVFWRLLLEYVPAAAVVTVPPSLLLGTLLAVRDRATSYRRPRALMLRLLPAAATATAATLLLTTTVMPRTNQAFRETVFTVITGSSYPVAPGDRELTLGELGVAISQLESAGDPRAAGYRVERQKRFAMPAACGAFGLVALGVAGRVRRLGVLTSLASCSVASACYYVLARLMEQAGDAGRIPAVVAAWLPNLVLAAIGVCLLAAGRDRDLVPQCGSEAPPAT
jgi:hypothetical protein